VEFEGSKCNIIYECSNDLLESTRISQKFNTSLDKLVELKTIDKCISLDSILNDVLEETKEMNNSKVKQVFDRNSKYIVEKELDLSQEMLAEEKKLKEFDNHIENLKIQRECTETIVYE